MVESSELILLVGHERQLCLPCPQIPRKRFRFEGGLKSSSESGGVNRAGMPGTLPGLGTPGKGQVVS